MARRTLAYSIYLLTVTVVVLFGPESHLMQVVLGLGIVLLMDRHLFRVVNSWQYESNVRMKLKDAGYILLASGCVVLFSRGWAPWWEVCLIGLLCGCAVLTGEQIVTHFSRKLVSQRKGFVAFGVALPFVLIFASFFFIAPVLLAVHPLHLVCPSNPSDLKLSYESVQFTTSDGVVLRGWFVPSAAKATASGSSNNEPEGTVIYCHGHGGNRGQVLGMLRVLVESGWNVLTFDFRGHGQSSGHNASFGHRERADVLAAYEYVTTREHKPVVLIGVSYGAAIALQSLRDLPNISGAWVEASFAQFDHVAENQFDYLPSWGRDCVLHASYLLVWLDCGFWPHEIRPIDCLDDVSVPITFVHGRQDDLIPFREGELLYDSYQGPKDSFWVDDANHFNLFHSSREEYLERLRMFLESVIER